MSGCCGAAGALSPGGRTPSCRCRPAGRHCPCRCTCRVGPWAREGAAGAAGQTGAPAPAP